MEPHELRVGNWVYEDKNPQDVGNPIGPWIYQMEAKEIQFANWYEPIPLDEKWLKRAGFQLDISWYHDEMEGCLELLSDGSLGYTYDLGYRPLVNIQYVHQLQNLFWCLTGKELEINVPVA